MRNDLKGSLPLYTERCVIRFGMMHDAERLLAYRSENREHLAPWEPRRDADYFSVEQCRQSLLDGLLAARDERGFAFLVLDQDQREVLATFTFANVVRGAFQACHLGYGLAAKEQGRGLMGEALRAGLDWAFGPLGLHRVMANYQPHNTRSGKLLERLGFRREGYAPKYLRLDGEWRDHILTALVAPDQ